MSDLHPFLRRTPKLFYGAALIVAAWVVVNSWLELIMLPGLSNDVEGLELSIKLKVLYEAVREAIYIASIGVSTQIMIAIYDKIGRGKE